MSVPSCDRWQAALAMAVSELSDSQISRGWQTELGRTALCALGEYPERGVCNDADCVAAVVVGLQGPHCGSALLALEPSEALLWIEAPRRGEPWRPGDAQASLDAYVESAGALARRLCAALVPEASFGSARLVEESLPGALVMTHAPRDTLLISAELFLNREDLRLRAHVCVLLDSKLLAWDPDPRS